MIPFFSGLFPVFFRPYSGMIPEKGRKRKERKHFPEKERNLLSFKVSWLQHALVDSRCVRIRFVQLTKHGFFIVISSYEHKHFNIIVIKNAKKRISSCLQIFYVIWKSKIYFFIIPYLSRWKDERSDLWFIKTLFYPMSYNHGNTTSSKFVFGIIKVVGGG